jgi:L-alanine-DL-glutamate epimerase-like enolase superfamily enzyme
MTNLTRRGFVTSAGIAVGARVALATQASQARRTRLKITDIRTFRLRTIKEVGTLEPAWAPGSRMAFRQGGDVVVEVVTDQGLTGIGPAGNASGIGAARAALTGKDPFDIDFPAVGGPGVDIALWDLVGKACGQPLYKLFRAAKDKVPTYASLVQLSSADERAQMAARLASEGWRAIKLRIHHDTLKEDIGTVEAVRKAVGDRMEIMVDGNQAQSAGNWQPGPLWDFRRALETARELERLGCGWLEEPLPRYHFDQLAELNRLVAIPLAGGENNRGIHEYLQMLQQGVYDILQPEVANSGISDLRKIGALADAFGRKVVPHHGGSGLGIMAHLHLIASWPHAPCIELLHDPPICDYRDHFSIFEEPPVVDKEGYLALPQKPGLGVEVKADWIIKG